MVELFEKGKISPKKSLYDALLVCLKLRNNKLRCVVEYRALNCIKKKRKTPLPRSDDMFDRLGVASEFLKLGLRIVFYQIRVRPAEFENTAFITNYAPFDYLVIPI